jgi:hypothetical protein
MSQTRAFFLPVRHNRFFNVTVDLWLSAIGRTDKSIKARWLTDKSRDVFIRESASC